MNAPYRDPSLPSIDPRVWHGPMGDVVKALAPTTEADPVGILVSLMAYLGTNMGPGPHVVVGNREQPARIWPLIVGATGAGRKGTSTADAEYVVNSFDSCFVDENSVSGLSTGEGIINNLRDEDGEHPGVTDKRRVVVEPEFARTLGVTRREGNNLSEVLRGLWESGRASVITRGQPLKCSDAHLSVIAHITPRELRMKLAEKDVAGGMMNRFLPVYVHRSQLIAHEVEPADITELGKLLARRIRQARTVGRVRRTAAADRLWTKTYRALSQDEPEGVLGEVVARGPVYVLRLALLYALMDGDDVIDVQHLMAALGLWAYVTTSARLIFGHLSGRSDLDKLKSYLQEAPTGRTATEVNAFFGRNKTANEIQDLVLDLGEDISVTSERAGGLGRPTVRYLWAGGPADAVAALLGTNERNEETREGVSADGHDELTKEVLPVRLTTPPPLDAGMWADGIPIPDAPDDYDEWGAA